MAQGLNLVIELTSGQESAAAGLVQALAPAAGGTGPQILHYAWAIDVTDKIPPKTAGNHTVLLTTVYDEDFSDYISDLVTANPGPFNYAAASIVGLENLRPVESPENLPKFIQFVMDNDLNKGGADNPTWFQAYSANVVTILACLPPSQ
jgi:hypothetical protein